MANHYLNNYFYTTVILFLCSRLLKI